MNPTVISASEPNKPGSLKATKTRRGRKPIVYGLLAGEGWIAPRAFLSFVRGQLTARSPRWSYEEARLLRQELDAREYVAETDPDRFERHERMLGRILQSRGNREWSPSLRAIMLDQLRLLDCAKDLRRSARYSVLDFEEVMRLARARFRNEYGEQPLPLPAALEREADGHAEDEWHTEQVERRGYAEKLRLELGSRFIAETEASKRPEAAGTKVRDWRRKMGNRVSP